MIPNHFEVNINYIINLINLQSFIKPITTNHQLNLESQ